MTQKEFKDFLTKVGVLNENQVINRWNYGSDYKFDVFILSKKLHRNLHGIISIDNESRMFKLNGELLDTKNKHREVIDLLIAKKYPSEIYKNIMYFNIL